MTQPRLLPQTLLALDPSRTDEMLKVIQWDLMIVERSREIGGPESSADVDDGGWEGV